MVIATPIFAPASNTLPPSRLQSEVFWLPLRLKTYTLLNSSARHLRKPLDEEPSIQPPLLTKQTTPRSAMRSEAHLKARM